MSNNYSGTAIIKIQCNKCNRIFPHMIDKYRVMLSTGKICDIADVQVEALKKCIICIRKEEDILNERRLNGLLD